MYLGVSRIFPDRNDGFALERYFVIPHVGTAATSDLSAIQTAAQTQQSTLVQYSLVSGGQLALHLGGAARWPHRLSLPPARPGARPGGRPGQPRG